MPVDERFYTYKGPQELRTLLDVCELEATARTGPQIRGIASATKARKGDICFFEGDPRRGNGISAEATACFVTEEAAEALPEGVVPVVVSHPRYAHKRAGEALYELKAWTAAGEPPSVHPSAEIAPTAVVGAGAAIGECAQIAPGAVIVLEESRGTEIDPPADLELADRRVYGETQILIFNDTGAAAA